MIWQVEDERFDNIIVGEYYNNDGKLVRGIYTTVDDSCAIININVLDRLLSGVKILEGSSSGDITLEEAEKKFGDQIIKKYLSANGVADIFSLEEVEEVYGNKIIEKHTEDTSLKARKASKENQKKAVQASVERGKSNQAIIIKAVLEGLTKQEIEYSLGYSRTTINKALKDLTEQRFKDIWFKYRTSIFNGVDMKLFADFILCECDYKKYMKRLQFEHDVKFRQSVDKTIENIEKDRAAEARIKEVSKGLQEMGLSPVSICNGVALKPTTEEDDYFSKVISMCHEPVEDTKPVIIRIKSEESDRFIEKYTERLSNSETVLSARRGKFTPRTKTGITFAGRNKVADYCSESEESWKEPIVFGEI